MIKGVSFVGIAVKDIEGATRLYAEMFGLEPWDQGVMDMPGAKAIMLPLGGCSIELLQPTASQDDPVGGDLARWLDKRGEGFAASVSGLMTWTEKPGASRTQECT